MSQVGGGGQTYTLPGSGALSTNDLVSYAGGDLGSPFVFPNDARNIWNLPGGVVTFPNDLWGKSHTTSGNQ